VTQGRPGHAPGARGSRRAGHACAPVGQRPRRLAARARRLAGPSRAFTQPLPIAFCAGPGARPRVRPRVRPPRAWPPAARSAVRL